jgi:hypothetical protein
MMLVCVSLCGRLQRLCAHPLRRVFLQYLLPHCLLLSTRGGNVDQFPLLRVIVSDSLPHALHRPLSQSQDTAWRVKSWLYHEDTKFPC